MCQNDSYRGSIQLGIDGRKELILSVVGECVQVHLCCLGNDNRAGSFFELTRDRLDCLVNKIEWILILVAAQCKMHLVSYWSVERMTRRVLGRVFSGSFDGKQDCLDCFAWVQFDDFNSFVGRLDSVIDWFKMS